MSERNLQNSDLRSGGLQYYDMHLHVLPGIDDGSRSVRQSIEMLKSEVADGCIGCIATPHYYPKESIRSFLNRRDEAWDTLRDAVTKEIPGFAEHILLGAEVYYNQGLVRDDDLDRLCIGRSRYMLLEMPFKQWSTQVLKDVRALISVRGITPIIAHYERFLKLTDKASQRELLDMDVVIQMNTGNLLRFGTKRKALRMIQDGTVQILGTDSHNTKERAPNFREAVVQIEKAGLGRELDRILKMNEVIYVNGVLGSEE